MKKVKVHKGGVRCVEYTQDGAKVISGGKDKSIKVKYYYYLFSKTINNN